MAVEIKRILSQGTFDFGWANRVSGEEHFETFKTALTAVVDLLRRWFGVSRAIWEAKWKEEDEWLFSRFLKGKVPLLGGIDITEDRLLSELAHDIYYTTESFEFRIFLWSDETVIAVEGCSDPVVFSFTVRPPRG